MLILTSSEGPWAFGRKPLLLPACTATMAMTRQVTTSGEESAAFGRVPMLLFSCDEDRMSFTSCDSEYTAGSQKTNHHILEVVSACTADQKAVKGPLQI